MPKGFGCGASSEIYRGGNPATDLAYIVRVGGGLAAVVSGIKVPSPLDTLPRQAHSPDHFATLRGLGAVVVEGPMRTLVLGVLAFVAAGCASTGNTPAQDRTWAAYAKCRDLSETRLQIDRVAPDGRWSWQPIAHNEWTGWQQVNNCMSTEIVRLRRAGQ